MRPLFLLLFLLSLVLSITGSLSQESIFHALIIALEGPDNSTTLLAPTPTLITLDMPTDTTPDETNGTTLNQIANTNLAPTRTVTQTARVTQTLRPTDPEPIIIFPFHISLTEHCSLSSSQKPQRRATALFTNGDWATRIVNLGSKTAATVNHRISDYPRTLRVGPYDTNKGELRFSYKNGGEWGCEWGDAESWRECGECRVGMWDAEGGECDGDEGDAWVRTKEMDCSFILGWKHQLRAPLAKPPVAEC